MKVYLVWENYYDYAENWVTLMGVFKTLKGADDECARLVSLLPKGDTQHNYHYEEVEPK